jgi:hypothetical protein
MMKFPRVVGIVLCERVDYSPQGEVSFLNVFHALHFPTYPSPAQSFTMYAALYDGEGEGTMELVLSRLETEQDRILQRRWFTFSGRGQVVNVTIDVTRYVFPAPGRYGFTLLFDGRPLTLRYLELFRTEGQS